MEGLRAERSILRFVLESDRSAHHNDRMLTIKIDSLKLRSFLRKAGRNFCSLVVATVFLIASCDLGFCDTSKAPDSKLDLKIAEQGVKLFRVLSRNDSTVNYEIQSGTVRAAYASLDLREDLWRGLSKDDHASLIELIKTVVQLAKKDPGQYVTTPASSPDYSQLIQSIREMKDGAWEIRLGHLDHNALVIDKIVLKGGGVAGSIAEEIDAPASSILPQPLAIKNASVQGSEISSNPSGAPITGATPNPLDVFMQSTQARGVTCIDRYYIKDDMLYIELNEANWSSLDKEHQHRMCDLLAQTDFITEMNVPAAYLTLDGERTIVGSISHDGFSPHCIFNPSADYWNYK
jgi:hypothetical protein